MKLIEGKDITWVKTIKSMYDNDSIEVYAGGVCYRLKAEEIQKMVKSFTFEARQARVHTYLEVSNA